MIRIGFIGAGLIGKERVRAVDILMRAGYPLHPSGLLDPFAPHANDLAKSIGTICHENINQLIEAKPDWVVVATPHDIAVDFAIELLRKNIKILIEKPLGRNLAEAKKIAAAAKPQNLWVGQNYRFYEGIAALIADAKSGRFGTLTSMSLLLGHGGGPKDVGTWKLDPVRAGGGVTIDPGIHLLDLVNYIEGAAPSLMGGTSWSGFWNTGIEEDVHIILKGNVIPSYSVTVSLVHWRSTCRLEIHGTEGYGLVEGRGRSYGPQRYMRGPRWGWQKHKSQAESEEIVLETDGADVFVEEMRTLLFGETKVAGTHPCSLQEALLNMQLLESIRDELALPSPDRVVATNAHIF